MWRGCLKELKQSKQEKAGLQKALAEEKEKNTRLAQERDNLKKETSEDSQGFFLENGARQFSSFALV